MALKREIIVASASKGPTELAKQFELPQPTISTILANKQKILDAVDTGNGPKRAHLKRSAHENLDNAVVTWLKQVRSENECVDGKILRQKGRELAELMGITNFQASDGWLSNLKRRHGIVFSTLHGEAAGINMKEINEWKASVLRELLDEYEAENIFNVDETALFWKLTPSKTMALKGERCTSGKRSKERVTVLVGSNMSGSEKCPLLVIGKSSRPRCFKNVKSMPVLYKANSKAWMTGEFFEDYLKKWNAKLIKFDRKILLFIDNCPAHPKLNFSNIRLQFFLPNATAEIQPMDMGIIKDLKVKYRSGLLRQRILAIDQRVEFKFDLLDSIHLLEQSWIKVKVETLENCFRKAGFVRSDAQPDNEDFDDDEFDNDSDDLVAIWEQQHDLDPIVTAFDYLTVDDNVVTSGLQTLEEIAAAFEAPTISCESESESEGVVEIEKSISRNEAYLHYRQLREYAKINGDKEVFQATAVFDNFFFQLATIENKQSLMTDFFVKR